MIPASRIATVKSEVAIGLLTKGAEMFTFWLYLDFGISVRSHFWLLRMANVMMPESHRQPVEGQVDDRSCVQCENLADQQAADDADAERSAQFRARSRPESKGNTAEQRRHGCHHNGPESQQARLIDGFVRRFSFFPFRIQRKVDHHNCILLYNTDK